jgi:hypothetical protein
LNQRAIIERRRPLVDALYEQDPRGLSLVTVPEHRIVIGDSHE